MDRKTKDFDVVSLKTIEDSDTPGMFEAVVAVFNNVDLVGDRIEKGAFARTLKENGLPAIVWSHNWQTPPIGAIQEAKETDEGLLIKGRLFVGEGEDHQIARQVYAAMKAKDGNGDAPLRQFSFAYNVVEASMETEDGDDVYVLKDLDVFEVGPCLRGANPATRLVDVKDISGGEPVGETDPSNPKDNVTPNAEKAEEAEPRIRELLTQRPMHTTPEGTNS